MQGFEPDLERRGASGPQVAVVGLGVMGANLARNLVDAGNAVAVFDRDAAKVSEFTHLAAGGRVFCHSDVGQMLSGMTTPRIVILLVPAGEAVDEVLVDLLPGLSADDVVIDMGNSLFDLDAKRAAECFGEFAQRREFGIGRTLES